MVQNRERVEHAEMSQDCRCSAYAPKGLNKSGTGSHANTYVLPIVSIVVPFWGFLDP